ncbi:MAG: hypothetical protein HY557_03380 [Euryarchaeota archaeon]|nr:hypothetical protein [Euryarchaeota archaeon]
MSALVVAFLVAAIPTAVYQLDKVLGLLAAILTADLAALLAVLATRGAGHHYDRIEA